MWKSAEKPWYARVFGVCNSVENFLGFPPAKFWRFCGFASSRLFHRAFTHFVENLY